MVNAKIAAAGKKSTESIVVGKKGAVVKKGQSAISTRGHKQTLPIASVRRTHRRYATINVRSLVAAKCATPLRLSKSVVFVVEDLVEQLIDRITQSAVKFAAVQPLHPVTLSFPMVMGATGAVFPQNTQLLKSVRWNADVTVQAYEMSKAAAK